MKTLRSKIALTALLTAGLGSIALSPAQANDLKNAKIGGSAPSDYLLYDSDGTNTYVNPSATLDRILSGNAANPTGNIELAASSEKAGFDFSKTTTLEGTIGGRSISFSSLTSADWSSGYEGTTFGRYWFNQALSNNGLSAIATTDLGTELFGVFQNSGGFQRFSDPNISYVNQTATGDIKVGLAGHADARPLFSPLISQVLNPKMALLRDQIQKLQIGINRIESQIAQAPNASTVPAMRAQATQMKLGMNQFLSALEQMTTLQNTAMANPIQMSEVVKYSYNGVTDYAFSFTGMRSGLVEKSDGISHNANYELTIKGLPPIVEKSRVPEPAVLSLAGVGGWAALKRRQAKKA
jgi:hypothetical protein